MRASVCLSVYLELSLQTAGLIRARANVFAHKLLGHISTSIILFSFHILHAPTHLCNNLVLVVSGYLCTRFQYPSIKGSIFTSALPLVAKLLCLVFCNI